MRSLAHGIGITIKTAGFAFHGVPADVHAFGAPAVFALAFGPGKKK